MPTDYSPLDALPAPQGSDVASVTAFTALRDALDGKLTLTCTSATRPTGTARFAGRLIYETDTKMWRTWNGSRWAWGGGQTEIRTVTLPSVAAAAAAYVTFPILSTSTLASQTNDPDSTFSIVTTAGGQGIKCNVAGWYQASIISTSSANSANALLTIFTPGEVFYGPGIYGPSGATGATTQVFSAAANDVVVPKVYTYSGTQTYVGTLRVWKLSEK